MLIICSLMKMKGGVIFFWSIAACQSLHAVLPERSVSPSHQFIIYGADVVLRGAVSNLAEQTKTNLLALLRQRDAWKIPVVINLQPQQANLPEIPPAELHFSQTGFGPREPWRSAPNVFTGPAPPRHAGGRRRRRSGGARAGP